MKLLHAIYSNPAQLLDKAKRDGASLIRALEECDEQEVRDVLFNFASEGGRPRALFLSLAAKGNTGAPNYLRPLDYKTL
jgi:hypothetical protein